MFQSHQSIFDWTYIHSSSIANDIWSKIIQFGIWHLYDSSSRQKFIPDTVLRGDSFCRSATVFRRLKKTILWVCGLQRPRECSHKCHLSPSKCYPSWPEFYQSPPMCSQTEGDDRARYSLMPKIRFLVNFKILEL